MRKCKLDESQYEEWDSELIADWIISLHDEYKGYEEILRKNLKIEAVDGASLPDLDKGDLHRFGILQFKHKNQIMQSIKKLTSKKAQQQEAAPAAYQPHQFQNDIDGPGSTEYI